MGGELFLQEEQSHWMYNNYKKMQLEIQKYLSSCESYLMNPEHVEPNELAQYFASYFNFGVNDLIASLVQRYFYLNLNHPSLLRYIQLLDRLIKMSFPLPRSFVTMYAQCFHISVVNGRKTVQEELKILRKMWTPFLNDNLISDLRSEVYKLTRIDVERDLREESKKFLAQYFTKYMNMSPSQIDSILKKAPPLKIQTSSSNPFHHREFEDRKNPTLRPEEATKGQKALILYDKLRNEYNLSCKQCGRHFQTESAYEKHKEEHFETKMAQFKRNRLNQFLQKAKFQPPKAQTLQMTVKQWINPTGIEPKEQNMAIPIGQQLGLNRNCHICAREFDIQINDDVFIYKGTIRVNIVDQSDPKGQEVLMHGQCYDDVYDTLLLK